MLISEFKDIRVINNSVCYEFYLCNRSIQRVEVVGCCVSKVIKSKKVLLHLDDGTGIVQCVKFFDETDIDKSIPFSNVVLGDMVSIRGRLVLFDLYVMTIHCYTIFSLKSYIMHLWCRQLVIHAIGVEICMDPNFELLHWVWICTHYFSLVSSINDFLCSFR